MKKKFSESVASSYFDTKLNENGDSDSNEIEEIIGDSAPILLDEAKKEGTIEPEAVSLEKTIDSTTLIEEAPKSVKAKDKPKPKSKSKNKQIDPDKFLMRSYPITRAQIRAINLMAANNEVDKGTIIRAAIEAYIPQEFFK